MDKIVLANIEWSSWSTYFYAGVAAGIAWLIKNQIQSGKELVELRTIMKYYIERQTQDAVVRLDKANPAPANIRSLAQKYVRGHGLTNTERHEFTTWLMSTGTGHNPDADSAERSAALQILTGIKALERIDKPVKRWWCFWQ